MRERKRLWAGAIPAMPFSQYMRMPIFSRHRKIDVLLMRSKTMKRGFLPMKEIDVNALFCGIESAYKAVNKANRENPGTNNVIVLRISDYEKREDKKK